MKTIVQFKRFALNLLLCAALALVTSGTARATWSEVTVHPGPLNIENSAGAVDSSWNIFWCGVYSGPVYAVYWNGNAWAYEALGNASYQTNALAVDSVNHIVYYTADDGKIWVIYWTGSTWANVSLGLSANQGSQLCVDSNYHILWYLDQSGYLWFTYWNGGSWVEAKVDGTNKRSRFRRSCGADSSWHIVWYLTEDWKTMIATYWNGSSWVNQKHPALAGIDRYVGLCVQESTHVVYNLQDDGSRYSTRGGFVAFNGSDWIPGTCFKDGNLPAYTGYCVPTPNPYSCYFGYRGGLGCYLATYSGYARNWTSCRQDTTGLFPLAVGYDGRVILCYKSSVDGISILESDQ